MKKVGLLLLGKKGLISLTALKENDLLRNVAFAVIGEDTSIHNDYSIEIEKFCKTNGIEWFSRQEFSKESLTCKLLIAIGWRWLVDTNQYKLITIHDSLLPKFRGFNPLVTALIEGEKTIGATAIIANEGIDAGDIVAQEEIKIEYPIKIEDAINLIAEIYGKIIVMIVRSDDLNPNPQNHANASYSIWRNEDDYRIDWSWGANRIKRFIDAVGYPYLGALTNYNGKGIRISQASVIQDLPIVNRTPGKLFKIDGNAPHVVCGKGMIKIDKAVYDKIGQVVSFDKLRERLQ